MEGTDPAGRETLQKHFSDICDYTALDPSVLARHLFTTKIISNTAREAAKQELVSEDKRRDKLLGQVMAMEHLEPSRRLWKQWRSMEHMTGWWKS